MTVWEFRAPGIRTDPARVHPRAIPHLSSLSECESLEANGRKNLEDSRVRQPKRRTSRGCVGTHAGEHLCGWEHKFT